MSLAKWGQIRVLAAGLHAACSARAAPAGLPCSWWPDEQTSHCIPALNAAVVQGAGQMTGIVVAFYADLQPIREDGLVRVISTLAPLAAASEVPGLDLVA